MNPESIAERVSEAANGKLRTSVLLSDASHLSPAFFGREFASHV
jgi:hypothetical protein